MQERSEEQILSRLLELENDGQAERRAQLTGERYLSLLHDPDNGRSYVLRHGTDETDSIGHAFSHGCVRMLIPDVIDLYNRVQVGTPVYIGD